MARTGRAYPIQPVYQRPRPTVVAAATVPPPRVMVAQARVVRRPARGRLVSFRAPTTLPAAFDKPKTPVVARAAVVRRPPAGRIVSFRAPVTLPAAFDKPRQAMVMRVAWTRRQAASVFLQSESAAQRPVGVGRRPMIARAVGMAPRVVRGFAGRVVPPAQAVVTVPPPRLVVSRVAGRPTRPGRVSVARAPATLPAAFDKPPLVMIARAVRGVSRRAGSFAGRWQPPQPSAAPFAPPPRPVVSMAAPRRARIGVALVVRIVRSMAPRPTEAQITTAPTVPRRRVGQTLLARIAARVSSPPARRPVHSQRRASATRPGRVVFVWPGRGQTVPPAGIFTDTFTSSPAAGASDSPTQGVFQDGPDSGPSSDPTQGGFGG